MAINSNLVSISGHQHPTTGLVSRIDLVMAFTFRGQLMAMVASANTIQLKPDTSAASTHQAEGLVILTQRIRKQKFRKTSLTDWVFGLAMSKARIVSKANLRQLINALVRTERRCQKHVLMISTAKPSGRLY